MCESGGGVATYTFLAQKLDWIDRPLTKSSLKETRERVLAEERNWERRASRAVEEAVKHS